MPKTTSEFSQKTKNILAKRAGFQCSFPSCGKLTSGPHSQSDKSISIGEAAHIRGANPTSARYDSLMQPEDRSSVTNGIWMCRTHARLIDTDEIRYTVELLHKWKFQHEQNILQTIELSPLEKEERESIISEFINEPLVAQQIALDKSENWQYFLVRELLSSKFKDIEDRFKNLNKGFEHKPSNTIKADNLVDFWSEKMIDIQEIITSISSSALNELTNLCSPEGNCEPLKVKWICNIIKQLCEELVEWARDIKYSIFPDDFENIKNGMIQCAQEIFSEIKQLPKKLNEILSLNNLKGTHTITLTFKVPENFSEISEQLGELIRQYYAI